MSTLFVTVSFSFLSLIYLSNWDIDHRIGCGAYMNHRMFLLLGMAVLVILSNGAAMAQNSQEGKKIYLTYCSTCHGEKGKGDGMAAQSLPVRPMDHTNGALMNPLSDKFLSDVIAKGGSAVGKSSFMPAWGGAFNDQQIRDIVAYLRTIADPPYTAGAAGK